MLTLGYLALSIVMLVLVLGGYFIVIKRQGSVSNALKKTGAFLGIHILWGIYVHVLISNEVLLDYRLPPRFILFILLPLVIAQVFFWIRYRNNTIVQSIPLEWTTGLQIFRIAVEFLLLYTFYENILPESATFEGYNFDILMGIMAPFMAYFFVHKFFHRKVLIIWNVLGIFMILWVVVIVGTSTYLPHLWNSSSPLVDSAFFSWPYFLVPAYLAPLGIFLHVVSLARLCANK